METLPTKNVVVLGAGGIVGQHMALTVPSHVNPRFVRRTSEPGMSAFQAIDLCVFDSIAAALDRLAPDVVINLAGENRVDVVEQHPAACDDINVRVPGQLAEWCYRNRVRLIQGSTQGVFSGEEAPYTPTSQPDPLTAYGVQKVRAEIRVLEWDAIIARLTFVLGVRPFPTIGRTNPLEDMLEHRHQFQVNDRWFSPLMATDAAAELWRLVDEEDPPQILHLGEPLRTTRYLVCCELAWRIGVPVLPAPVSHEFFPGIAQRPFDTHWRDGTSRFRTKLRDGVCEAYELWKDRNGPRLKSA